MSSSPTTPKRSKIWYQDGSVVLQADNTQFRVHWGVLAHHSAFFHDLLTLPQPPDQPNVDGCPLIELSDDATDVGYLLSALYDPSVNRYTRIRPFTPMLSALFDAKALPFPYIASFVRLGRKYDFKSLLDIAMKRLAHENPTSLEEYDALLVARLTEASIASHSERTTRILHYPGVHFDILTLARENDLLALLPCAYFRIAKDSLENIFQEVQRPDGTASVLSIANRTVCSLGHEKLLRAQWEPGNTLVWMIFWEPSTDCLRRTKCQRFRDSFLASILVSPRVYAFIYVPSAEEGLCAACAKPAGAAMRAGRAKIWEALPSFFDLPPWNELQHLDEL